MKPLEKLVVLDFSKFLAFALPHLTVHVIGQGNHLKEAHPQHTETIPENHGTQTAQHAQGTTRIRPRLERGGLVL
jgi:hypothetical protein